MTKTINMTISIRDTLFDEAEALAQQLNISRSQLLEIAIEDFIKKCQSYLPDESNKEVPNNPHEQAERLHQDTKSVTQLNGRRGVANQGDIYWAQIDKPNGSEPGYLHPHVVIQDDVFNRSRITSVLVCALTSNIKRANEAGNVLLEEGEANLPKQSVVVVSQISTVDEMQLGEYIGSLTRGRINQILSGMRFQQLSFFAR